jgi:hypothetical protein
MKPQLILYAIGGIFVLLVVYTLRDYVLIGLISAGAVYLYKLITESNDRKQSPLQPNPTKGIPCTTS